MGQQEEANRGKDATDKEDVDNRNVKSAQEADTQDLTSNPVRRRIDSSQWIASW